MSKLLFSARTTNGNSTAFETPKRKPNSSQRYSAVVYGTFDGCTVKLQASVDDVTYVDIPDASWTAATVVNLEIRVPYIRASVASAGAGTSVSVWVG